MNAGCPACANATTNRNSGIYKMQCEGCAARALAQSPEFHCAAKSGTMTPQYRMALSQFFPGREAEGHKRVKEWVR